MFLFTAVTACSGPAMPQREHAPVQAPVQAPVVEATEIEAPVRAVLVCAPEPAEDTNEDANESSQEGPSEVAPVVRRALGEHARCAPQLFAGSSFAEGYGSARVAAHGGTVEVDASSSGQGVARGNDVFFALLDAARCRPLLTVETGWSDGALLSPARVGVAPARRVLGLLATSTLLRAYLPTASEAALFQLLMRQPPRDQQHTHPAQTFVLRGPLYGAAPALAGTPQPSELDHLIPTRGLGTETLGRLRVVLAAESERTEDEAEPDTGPLPEFVRVIGLESGFEDFAIASFIVRSYRLLGRDSGALVALIDTTSNTYRWVLETRSAVLGSSLQWRGVHRGFLVGEYHSDSPRLPYETGGGVVLLRLEDGAIFELDVPGIFERGESMLTTELEQRASVQDEACREVTTRAFAASTGYPISELEHAPWWCREHEVLVRLRAELAQTCDALSGLHGVRVDGGELRFSTLNGERLVSFDDVITSASSSGT